MSKEYSHVLGEELAVIYLLLALLWFTQFAKAHSEELGVQTVPSLNLVYTEEEGYVTADMAEEKNLVSLRMCLFLLWCFFQRVLLLLSALLCFVVPDPRVASYVERSLEDRTT